MDTNVLVSVIVPIYNCEKYIETCLRSIENQTYQNLEIICIDDGSKDRSRSIVENCLNSMEKKHIFIKHDTNHGVGFARNCGLRNARGEVIVFVDGDDYIEFNMIEYMCKAMTEKDEIDYVIVPYKIIFDNEEKKTLKSKEYKTRMILPQNLLKTTTAVWGGAYKRQIILENAIFFEETMKNKEDGLWIMEYSMYSKNIVFVEGTSTYYRKHKGSITNMCIDVQWEADSIYYLLLKWKQWGEKHVITKQQKELFWCLRRTWVNGYFDTCSREKSCKIYNLGKTKLPYITILYSAMPIKKRFIELFMNFSLCENTIFFSMLKRFLYR